MTDYRVYIGEIVDPALRWDDLGDHWARNVREVAVLSRGLDAMQRVFRLLDSGRYIGRQLDWGAWMVELTPEQLRELYPKKVQALAGGPYVLIAEEGP